MKGLRRVKVALPVAAMMLVTALPVTPAAAVKSLVLKSGGTAVANGSPGDTSVTIEECGIFSNGKVGTNKAATVTLTETTSSNSECPTSGMSISGLIKENKMTATGKDTLKGAITLSLPGPCVYKFSAFKPAVLGIPGFAFVEGKTTGVRIKPSILSCAKTTTQTYFAGATNAVFGEPFETAFG